MSRLYEKYVNTNYKFDKLTLFGILCLISVLGGIFGFIYELIFYYFNGSMKQLYMRGGNFLPWINIYAIGAILIYFITFKLRKKPLKVFLISVVTSGILEFLAGWILYNFFGKFRCWDYNTEILNFGNIEGFVCLRSVLFFGISGLILIYLIVPFCIYLLNKIGKKRFVILSITLFSIIMFDELYNLLFARLLNLPRASDIYKSIGFKYVKF